MEHSAGIIPFRKNEDGKIEFFLGHPTGAKNYWAYLKGRTEDTDEDIEVTARREFTEESGQKIPEGLKLIYLGEVRQRSNKKVTAFAVEWGEIDPKKCFSNLIEDSDKPEVDKYRWMVYEQVISCTHKTHINFYKSIIEMSEPK